MLNDKFKKFGEWVVYQIYPRSFYDSNGDGIGDLNGITSKLDHLAELGVNAVWLSPCYKSPNDDNGYDISDYRDIMDEFGTLGDWKTMISEMHKRNIRLIMDLVPNHTSTSHEWFKKSRLREEPYSDYYYWFDKPQNDWYSCFGGSAWEFDDVRGQYYLHSYAISQADLNWDNPKVREEIKDVIDYWVNLGVDGFRIDVIDQISKNFDGENAFGPNLHKYINEMFGREKVKHIFTVGECWCEDIDEVIRHCGQDRDELSTLFRFDHFDFGREGRFEKKPFSLDDIFKTVSKAETLSIENDILYTAFTDNHDQPRFVSRFGNDTKLRYESATMFATAFYMLRGVPFILQGQEIGVVNSKYEKYDCFKDIENVHYYNTHVEEMGEKKLCLEKLSFGSRDNARRPMPWNSNEYGGFSTSEPWLCVNSDYKKINVERDKKSKKSVFAYYKKLLGLRSENQAVTQGDYKEIRTQGCFIYERTLGDEKILVVCNYGEKNKIELDYEKVEVLLENYSAYNRKINGKYKPYETAVYRVK